MTLRPTIAMLVPAFNAAVHLPRLLDSAARQTEPFDEIWVYDDCSTDDTAAIAERYGAVVVRGDMNRGCTCAKNTLAASTEADWLHFHDADDELGPTFVALARRWMAEDSADIVLFPYEVRDDATGNHMGFRFFDATDIAGDPRSYAIREQINPFCGLYRRAAFLRGGGYDEDPVVHYNEDVAMHIRLAFAGLTFAAEKDIAIINHRRSISMSAANRLKCLQAQYQVMRKTARCDGAQRYAPEIATKLWRIVGGLASELDWRTADDAAALAMQLAGPTVAPTGIVFKALCRLSPRFALRAREWLIRGLKPRYRESYPGWRAPVSLL